MANRKQGAGLSSVSREAVHKANLRHNRLCLSGYSTHFDIIVQLSDHSITIKCK